MEHSFLEAGRAGGIHIDYHLNINNPPPMDCCSISSVAEQWILMKILMTLPFGLCKNLIILP
jgi:hypothetical protein